MSDPHSTVQRIPPAWQSRVDLAVEAVRSDPQVVAECVASFEVWAGEGPQGMRAHSVLYARLLRVLAVAYQETGSDAHDQEAQHLCAAFLRLRDPAGEALAWAARLVMVRQSNQPRQAWTWARDHMLPLRARMHACASRVLVCNLVAVLASDAGEQDTAAGLYYAALEDARSLGLLAREAHISANVGEMMYMSGNIDDAQTLLDRAMALCALEPSEWLSTFVCTAQALCYLAQRNPHAAMATMQPLIDRNLQQLGASEQTRVLYFATAALALAQTGRIALANFHAAMAHKSRELLNERQLSPYAWWASGHCHRAEGKLDLALQHLERAVSDSKDSGYAFMPMNACFEMFEIHQQRGEWLQALDAHQRFHSLHTRVHNQSARMRLHLLRAESERDAAKQEAQQQRHVAKLKSSFIGMASHEFRTPLAAIQSSVDLLRHYQDRLGVGERERVLQELDGSVQRLKFTMDQVLLLAKSDADKLPVQMRALDWLTATQDVVREQHLARSNRNPISLHLASPELANLRPLLDHGLFRQALGNLLGNACKYSAEGQAVVLRVAVEPMRHATTAQTGPQNALRFDVIDQGLGIQASDHARMFGTFERGSNTEHISGTGLGLAIVKRAMDAMGGHVSFSSEIGKGSVFSLWFVLG